MDLYLLGLLLFSTQMLSKWIGEFRDAKTTCPSEDKLNLSAKIRR